jgi:alpha-N-acetylglucosamine transferase
MLSPRKLRVVLISGILVFFVAVFIRLDKHLANLPAQFRQFTQHNISSEIQSSHNLRPITTENIRWSDFTYVQYVTNSNYLCNSLMILEALRRHGTQADLLMMYPREWVVPVDNDPAAVYEGRLLAQARDMYNTKLVPIQVKTFVNDEDTTWQDSYTKLLAWNQTQYKRVISLDSDATVLDVQTPSIKTRPRSFADSGQHMDELFLLPPAPVAMPRAYWMDDFFLSSQIIVIEPSEESWQRVQNAMEHHEGHEYDMDILNKVFGKSTLVIPHRRYDLLTGEFRHKVDEHEVYLGSPTETWNAREILDEAKFVHFSDWPMPKPWKKVSNDQTEMYQPECRNVSVKGQDCTDREVWLELRNDFAERRQVRDCCSFHARETDNF